VIAGIAPEWLDAERVALALALLGILVAILVPLGIEWWRRPSLRIERAPVVVADQLYKGWLGYRVLTAENLKSGLRLTYRIITSYSGVLLGSRLG
jgi:hypothetical protein